MKIPRNQMLAVAVALGLWTPFFIGCEESATSPKQAGGKLLGEFSLVVAGTGEELPASTWEGKLLVLVFERPTCIHCVRAAPSLQDTICCLYESRGVQLVAVCTSTGISDSTLVDFARRNGWTFPTCRANAPLMAHIGVQFVPFVALLDRDGVLVYKDSYDSNLIHDSDVSALRRKLDELLAPHPLLAPAGTSG
jgi:hypothetical protein